MALLSKTNLVCVALCFCISEECLPTAARAQANADPVIQTFPVANDGDLLIVPVKLKGKKYDFAIDTGATSIVYDSSLRSLLGEFVQAGEIETVSKTTGVSFFKAPQAWLGKLSLQVDTPVVCADLTLLREVSGHDLYGIVGVDFLRRHVFEVDPDRNELRFFRSPCAPFGRRLPVSWLRDKYPCVEVAVRGLDAPRPFIVDTGCAGTDSGSISHEDFSALVGKQTIKLSDVSVFATMSGVEKARSGWLTSITVAGNAHPNVLISEANDNILGLNYWLRFVTTFDLGRDAVYVQESRRFCQPDREDQSGLRFRRVRGQITVDSVVEGSPAALSGIKPQDVIVAVDGQSVDQVRLQVLRLLLCSQGKKVNLTVKHGNVKQTVVLALHDWRKSPSQP